MGCLRILLLMFSALSASVGAAAAKEFTDDEVTAAVRRVVSERGGDGAFTVFDTRSGETLTLVFDDVCIVRGLAGFGWFPNVNFHDRAVPARKYALDFWLKPTGDDLKLMDIRVHKAPQPDGGGWMSITRAPLAWWWLPTIERASAVAGMPAWQVMGSIHARIAEGRSGETLETTQPDGSVLSLQLIDIVQPVGRSKADGRYFACAILRKFGSEGGFYSIPYWLDAKTKLVTAGSVAPIGQVRGGEDKAAAEPRCDVGSVGYDIVD
ncbi:conserved exported protein of unknown function [Hyphomicrobium sp. 1Nfss2.1]|uniref:hypothetical protein n=1 Tax=Hyphomicrobium sp. 1Nfss2.1 TaxID=3413936 RepID=UPI003C7E17DF